MIYILIISLLIKKPFYLLRRQSFSFEIVSEFSNFMSRGWGFWLPVLSRGKGFCTQLLSRGEGFCSLRVVSRGFVPGGWFWMKLIPALDRLKEEVKRAVGDALTDLNYNYSKFGQITVLTDLYYKYSKSSLCRSTLGLGHTDLESQLHKLVHSYPLSLPLEL